MAEENLSVAQVAALVKGVDENWLRRRIRNKQIKVDRTGYNYTIPSSELVKIRQLVAKRPGKTP